MADGAVDDFDPYDRDSWYFDVKREEANNMLNSQRDSGIFLVRPSNTLRGDLVLCVKEDSKVSHYIINRVQVAGKTVYRIGDQEFSDVHQLLLFYKTHYLDSTPLRRPAKHEEYIAKYDFTGRDSEDLPFKKNEILTILSKDEEQWWTAKNSQGQRGSIPVPYIAPYDGSSPAQRPVNSTPEQTRPAPQAAVTPAPTLPATARVIKQRIPCAYDKQALRLEVGDIVVVTAMNVNGQWEGEVDGRVGIFPFNYVKFIEDEGDEDAAADS